MYDMNDQWDRYMLRYGGYSSQTLAEFEDRGIATYDEATDTYTVQCDHWPTGAAADCTSCEGRGVFTVGLSPEFA